MRLQQLQVSLVDQTRKQLPRALRKFEARSFFSLVKLHYDNPKLHYEVWVRGQDRLVEVGLVLDECKSQLWQQTALVRARPAWSDSAEYCQELSGEHTSIMTISVQLDHQKSCRLARVGLSATTDLW